MLTKKELKLINFIKKNHNSHINKLEKYLSESPEKTLETLNRLTKKGLNARLSANHVFYQGDWLCLKQLQSLLTKKDKVFINIKTSTNSTNEYLLTKPPSLNQTSILMAEYQSHGRGQHERSWQSPLATSLFLSLGFYSQTPLSNEFSMQVGEGLQKSLKHYGIEQQFTLKPPNDLLYQGKKLAGILIEGRWITPYQYWVIGIGLNCNMQHLNKLDINQPWTDLQTITHKLIDRNRLAAYVINMLLTQIAPYQINT